MLDVVELTKSLCAISSVTGDESAVVHFVADLLEKNGFQVDFQTLPNTNRSNIFATRPGVHPKILLTTHLDTVPPFFSPQVSGDGEWLIGRGVCDAKGIAAAMMCALIEDANPLLREVALLFVVGEETVSDGAKWAALNMDQKFEFLINGEPTDMKLVTSMKGAIVFELSSKGIAGHSAYPDSGDSALHRVIRDAGKLIDFEWPRTEAFGETTINIGTINGGEAPNVIAENAHIAGVIRLACSVSEGSAHLSSMLDAKTSLRMLSISEPRKLFTLSGEETCQVSFGCDIPHLEKLGTPLLFGPGSILDAHTDAEKVRISDLKLAAKKYAEICVRLLEKNI